MSSQKLNIGMVRGFSDLSALHQKMVEFGCPETEPSGLIDPGMSETAKECWGTLVTARPAVIKKLNRKEKVVEDKPIDKDLILPFKVRALSDGNALLEVYAGGAKTLEIVSEFITGSLNIAFLAEFIPVNMLARFTWLQTDYDKAVLKAAKVTGYKHSESVIGVFTSRFASTQDGREFIEKINASRGANSTAYVTNITVAFKCKSEKKTVKITMSNEACFTYSCNDNSTQEVGRVVRDIAGLGGVE